MHRWRKARSRSRNLAGHCLQTQEAKCEHDVRPSYKTSRLTPFLASPPLSDALSLAGVQFLEVSQSSKTVPLSGHHILKLEFMEDISHWMAWTGLCHAQKLPIPP